MVVVEFDEAAAQAASALGYLTCCCIRRPRRGPGQGAAGHGRGAPGHPDDADRKLALTLIARGINPKLADRGPDDTDTDKSWLPHAGASRVVLVDDLVAQALVDRWRRHVRHLNHRSRPSCTIQLDGRTDGKRCATVSRAAAESRRQREDHDQSRLRRPRPDRPAGRGRLLRQPHRSDPDRDPQPARPSRRCRQGSVARKSLDLGLRHYGRADLEAAREAGGGSDQGAGLASIAHDVTPELARATIASITVLGALHASPAVKAALADRIR